MPRLSGRSSRGFGASGTFPGGLGSAVAILEYAAQERVMAQYLYEYAGVPTDGTNGTYAHVAPPGALLINTDAKTLYQNTNTQASPTWTLRSAVSGGGVSTVSFFTHFGVIGDTSLQTYPLEVGGADDLGSVGSWSNDSNGDLVAPESGRYLCQFGLFADQSEVSPIAVSLQINSPTSAYLVEQIKLYLPVAPAGTAQVISTSGLALSQSLLDAPFSLGQLQVQHHIAGGVDADLRIFVRLFRVGGAS